MPLSSPLPVNRSATVTHLLNVKDVQGYCYVTEAQSKQKPVVPPVCRQPRLRALWEINP